MIPRVSERIWSYFTKLGCVRGQWNSWWKESAFRIQVFRWFLGGFWGLQALGGTCFQAAIGWDIKTFRQRRHGSQQQIHVFAAWPSTWHVHTFLANSRYAQESHLHNICSLQITSRYSHSSHVYSPRTTNSLLPSTTSLGLNKKHQVLTTPLPPPKYYGPLRPSQGQQHVPENCQAIFPSSTQLGGDLITNI